MGVIVALQEGAIIADLGVRGGRGTCKLTMSGVREASNGTLNWAQAGQRPRCGSIWNGQSATPRVQARVQGLYMCEGV